MDDSSSAVLDSESDLDLGDSRNTVDEPVVARANETVKDETVVEAETSEVENERAGIYLAALIALAVPSLIVMAFFLPDRTTVTADAAPTVNERAADLDESAVIVEEPEVDTTSSTDDVEPAPVAVESEDEAPTTTAAEPDTEVAGVVEDADGDEVDKSEWQSTTDAPEAPLPALELITAEMIEVTVYDETPPVDGRYTFAIRVKSVSTPTELSTDLFTVAVQDADGVAAVTSSRFLHPTLPVGSSALATVTAADMGSNSNVVVVSLGDVEIARVPIDAVA